MADSTGLLPHNVEAEQAVLGSMLIDPRAIERVIPLLSPDDFYLTQHADIYRAMVRVHDHGAPTDIIMVTNEYDPTMGDGVLYLASLSNLVPTSMNAEHYARIVERHAVLRRLVDAGTRISAIGYDERYEAGEALDEVDRMLKDARSKAKKVAWEDKAASLDRLEARLTGPIENDDMGIATGLPTLDAITGPWKRGDLVILGARPSKGKTSLAVTIARHVAMKSGKGVLFVSLEMVRDRIWEKLAAIDSGLSWKTITRHGMTESERAQFHAAKERIKHAPIDVVPAENMSIEDIWDACKTAQREMPLSLVVVDYIGLASMKRRRENQQQEIAAVSRTCKAMAMNLDCTVLALSQLNREPEHRTGAPKMSDLRDSGGLEQDTDIGLLLSLPNGEEKIDARAAIQEVLVDVGKNRMGEQGVTKLGFRGPQMQFVSIAPPALTSSQPRATRYDEEAAF